MERSLTPVEKTDKMIPLLTAIREIAIMVIASVEDYMAWDYDRSALAKRRAQVRSMVK